MLGADAKALRVSWTVLLCVLGVWAVYEVRHTLIVFTLALFLSHLLAPLIAAVVATLAVMVGFGFGLEKVVLRPLLGRPVVAVIMALGFADDRRHLPALVRLVISGCVFFALLTAIPNLVLDTISMSALGLAIHLGNFSVPQIGRAHV